MQPPARPETLAPQTAMTRRPVFLGLHRIALPVGAVVSFLHRVSGVLLVAALAPLALLFERSLASPEGFAALLDAREGAAVRIVLVLLAWALGHHVLAGVRHLLMDAGVGWRLAAARRSARLVIAAGVAIAALAALGPAW